MRFWSRLMQGFRSIDLNPHVVTMPADQLADLWESNEPDDAPGLRAMVGDSEYVRLRHWNVPNGPELIRTDNEPEETP
jgi:hypothetical protein